MADYYNILDTPSGGAFTLIDSQSVTNAASLTITDIPQTYSSLELYIDYMTNLTTGGDLLLRASINNGSSYLATGYSWGVYGRSTSIFTSEASGVETGTAFSLHTLGSTLELSSPYGSKMTILNYNDNTGDGYIKAMWTTAHSQSGGFLMTNGEGTLNSGDAIDALQLIASTGNITAATRLFGVT